ncbi:MAG: DUF1127 domain-containing protein [Devosia sp.]
MTTFELEDVAREQHHTSNPWGAVRQALAAMRQWHDRRRTLARISHLDEHLLRDAGLDPEDVRDALEGDGSALWEKWEQLHGAASRE